MGHRNDAGTVSTHTLEVFGKHRSRNQCLVLFVREWRKVPIGGWVLKGCVVLVSIVGFVF